MKKGLYILLAVTLLVAGYLFFSYRYFYFRLHIAGMAWPENKITYQIADTAKQNAGISKIYLALGDSLTYGVGADNYQQSYPYLIARLMAGNGQSIKLINRSYPGFKTADLINDDLNQAILDKPDLVTVMIGINDAHGTISAADFKKNYEFIVKRLTGETDAKIYLISIPFLGANDTLLPPYDFYFNIETRYFNKIVKDLARKYNASYVDLYSVTNSMFKEDGPQYSKDGYHPSAIGYGIWAKVICDDICK